MRNRTGSVSGCSSVCARGLTVAPASLQPFPRYKDLPAVSTSDPFLAIASLMIPIIRTENLTKVFRIVRKNPCLAGAVKSLFLPNYENKVTAGAITFQVNPGIILVQRRITPEPFGVMYGLPISSYRIRVNGR